MNDNEAEMQIYFQDGQIWEQQIIKSAMRSRALAWLLACLFVVITILLLLAFIVMLPLKTVEPYIVEVDKSNGYLEVKAGLTGGMNISDLEAVTQANIVKYIRVREGYDPVAIQENYKIAALFSTDNAARDLEALYNVSNPGNPETILGHDKVILVDIISVTLPNKNTALVRFTTTEKGPANTIRQNYISVVRFRYSNIPERNEWRFENPLGFQVYDYRRDQENLPQESDAQ